MPEMRYRLNHVCQDDPNWRRKLGNIDTKMGRYEGVKRENPGGDHEGILREILPTYWEIFHTHNIYQRKKNQLPSRGDDVNHLPCYGVGIFLVGYSSLPIVLSLAEIQPSQEIYFLYSSGTDGTMDRCFEIADRMRAMLNGLTDFGTLIDRVDNSVCDLNKFGLEVDNPSDPVETFKRIKEVIDNVGNKRIALDLTGGKKTMIGGGFTAGSILDFSDSIDMFYIDSLKYNPYRGSPKPGTEFLSRLDNPYDVYNVQTVQEAKKLFNKHSYDASVQLWEEVAKKLKAPVRGSKSPAEQYGLKDEQKVVQTDLGMASCYRFWDAFDYQAAKGCKFFSFYDPDAKRNFMHSWGYNKKHVHDSIDILDILSEIDSRKTTFKKESRVIHLAVDRYQNAMRRKEVGKFDDAIVRFAQTIEIICPYQLYQIAQTGGLFDRDSNKCLKDKIDPDNEEWNITSLIRFLFGDSKFYFGGNGAYVIKEPGEHLKETEYGQVSSILKLIRFRNDLVHVNRSTKQQEIEQNANNLQKLAKKFLENLSDGYISKQSVKFENLLELHRFRSASLTAVGQLVEELGCLSDSDVDQGRAIQIYNEKFQLLEGEAQRQIAQALKAYWQCINKWEDGSDKQTKKVMKIKSILGES